MVTDFIYNGSDPSLFLERLSMPPAVYFALLLLFSPTVILAEPVHVPLTRRLPSPGSQRPWHDIANNLRSKYGYPVVTSQTRRSNRRAVGGVGILDQVDLQVVIVLSHFNSSQK